MPKPKIIDDIGEVEKLTTSSKQIVGSINELDNKITVLTENTVSNNTTVNTSTILEWANKNPSTIAIYSGNCSDGAFQGLYGRVITQGNKDATASGVTVHMLPNDREGFYYRNIKNDGTWLENKWMRLDTMDENYQTIGLDRETSTIQDICRKMAELNVKRFTDRTGNSTVSDNFPKIYCHLNIERIASNFTFCRLNNTPTIGSVTEWIGYYRDDIGYWTGWQKITTQDEINNLNGKLNEFKFYSKLADFKRTEKFATIDEVVNLMGNSSYAQIDINDSFSDVSIFPNSVSGLLIIEKLSTYRASLRIIKSSDNPSTSIMWFSFWRSTSIPTYSWKQVATTDKIDNLSPLGGYSNTAFSPLKLAISGKEAVLNAVLQKESVVINKDTIICNLSSIGSYRPVQEIHAEAVAFQDAQYTAFEVIPIQIFPAGEMKVKKQIPSTMKYLSFNIPYQIQG